MKTLLALFLASLNFMFLDFIWLGYLAKNFYKREVGHLLIENPLSQPQGIISALVVYAALVAGIFLFVLHGAKNYTEVMIRGALFGLISYAIYDFTNLCTLKDWSLKVALVDVMWGAILCGTTALVAFWAMK